MIAEMTIGRLTGRITVCHFPLTTLMKM